MSGVGADFYSCYVYDGPNGVGQEDLVLDAQSEEMRLRERGEVYIC